MQFVALSVRLPKPAPLLRRVVAAWACGLACSATAATLYWDTNNNGSGAGATPTGNWSTSGGTNKNWSSSASGGSTATWTAGSDAVFSAGSDAINAYNVTLAANQSVASITIEEGSPTFNNNAINFNVVSANFTVAPGLTSTVNSDITGSLGFTKLGDGTVIFGTSDKSYTGTTTISLGTLQTNFDQTFSTVTLGGGTLALASATTTITTLNLSANSTIDFSGANASLLLTTLNLNGFTLSITGWTGAADYFYATNWAGVTKDVYDNAGATPVSLVQFQGYGANQTGWDSYNNEIRPNVPEPSTYGALLLGAMTGLFAWRRLVRRPAG